MNKQTTILMYDKYSGSFSTILELLFVSDQTYYLHLHYFLYDLTGLDPI